jgi:tRNA-Thr(GGU) m(6)t(6)A37 methyltransferase TsaA
VNAVELAAIGVVESTLVDRSAAPKQGNEGAPDAWLAINADVAGGLDGLNVGDEIFVLTWLHQSDRAVLRVHPRDDLANPERGVFSTRSSDRPNPIGLHRVRIAAVDDSRLLVRHMEAVNGTPILDIKPVIPGDESR